MVAKGRIKRPAKLSGASDMLAKNHRGGAAKVRGDEDANSGAVASPLPHQPA